MERLKANTLSHRVIYKHIKYLTRQSHQIIQNAKVSTRKKRIIGNYGMQDTREAAERQRKLRVADPGCLRVPGQSETTSSECIMCMMSNE